MIKRINFNTINMNYIELGIIKSTFKLDDVLNQTRLGRVLPTRDQACLFLDPTMPNGTPINQRFNITRNLSQLILSLSQIILIICTIMMMLNTQRYPGPTGPDPTHVGAAYFGLVPK